MVCLRQWALNSIQNLVRSMIQLNPADRLTFEEYLTDCRTDKTFPNAFYVFLHPFLLGLQETSATARPAPISKVASENPRGVVDSISRGAAYAHLTPVKNNSDEIIDTVWSDFGYVSRYFWVGKKRRRGTGSEDVEETNKFDLHSDKVEDAKGEGPGQGVVRFCLSSYFMEWSSVYLICLMFCQKKWERSQISPSKYIFRAIKPLSKQSQPR